MLCRPCPLALHCSAVDGEGLPHGALQMKSLDVVPILLEQRHEEVDGHQAVLPQFVWVHVHVAHRDAHAGTFFSWNLTMLRISDTLFSRASLCWHIVGNLPALLRPGPRSLGIWGMRTCEAKNASKD